MKTTVLSLLILICNMAVFPYAGLAQDTRPIVRLIYFLPSDREPQPDIDVKLDRLIKYAQQDFANLMETQGFGRKTFQIETDAKGKVVVHRVRGKFTEAYYHAPQEFEAEKEIAEQFDTSKNIYLTVLEISSEETCRGLGIERGLGAGGIAIISASGVCFGRSLTMHELQHCLWMATRFSLL